ncbi:DNA-binding MarR family transcriptional regulator [Aequitasia blattaphilus]|uniref:MarR family winged helix-turn-helix transcriptional regulator n=1 Tax=Aequitasia blattaphilus TaxID=2949332 RepID=A0ABT1EDI3_9FIRM|nr:MarR family winged helix-turn-helix transcriptional regulator [Aequitasia blattaphilus]MCP1103706.1 MarR family winged helix-turn-helix transcriptional regulator [Aequitasia blattaphilus]MCR8616346.1 MarR family winged helix-turn-helix transcriptional regulator [Aequitasia blattaphilus]
MQMQCDVIHKFICVMDAMNRERKTPKNYGTGDILYEAEVKMLEAICLQPGINATTLATQMDVTRGAITQMMTRLETKGYIKHYHKGCNKKEKYYKLTNHGEKIREAYNEHHKHANEKVCEYLSGLDPETRKIIIRFLDQIENLPITEFECGGACHHETGENKEK